MYAIKLSHCYHNSIAWNIIIIIIINEKIKVA